MKAIEHWKATHHDWFEGAIINICAGESEGWSGIVNEFFRNIELIVLTTPAVRFRVLQIKEKCRSIRVYHRLDGAHESVKLLISQRANNAVLKSMKICEVCGMPACEQGRCAQHLLKFDG